jgi:DNA (cytosine-5)-methyltransferase 1
MAVRVSISSKARDVLKVVSLYTGAGGMDYGFEAAGYRIRVAVEVDSDCCATLQANRKWPLIRKPIEQVSREEILRRGRLRRGAVDVLIGGPPCQPFSKSGYWTNGDTLRLRDPRARTLDEFMRCVNDLMPTAFLLENVHGLSYSGKEEGFQFLAKRTQEINRLNRTDYRLSWKVLNAVEYGVPQIRERFFVVAHRDGKVFTFPPPTHGEADGRQQATLFSSEKNRCVTAWDAIGNISRPSPDEDLRPKGRWADLLPSIPEGENYLWHTKRKGGLPLFGWRTRYWSFLLKLAKNKPSWTIQAQPGPAIGPFHWTSRLLSVREMAQLQTFPEDIAFVGSRRSIQMQIGNAVPSLLAEVLARAVASQFFGRTYDLPLRLAIVCNDTIPPPEKVAPVSRKYLSLAGDHPDHAPRYLRTKSRSAGGFHW